MSKGRTHFDEYLLLDCLFIYCYHKDFLYGFLSEINLLLENISLCIKKHQALILLESIRDDLQVMKI